MSDTGFNIDGTEGMIPALCTQCGANVEVDSNLRRASCPYCGTQFIVDQAVKNYQIKQAQFGNVGTVNITNKGTAESAFDFLDKQINRVEGYAGKAISYRDQKKREKEEAERKRLEEERRQDEEYRAKHHGLSKNTVSTIIGIIVIVGAFLLLGLLQKF